jgi:PAS domain S-box-containing protein
MPDETTKPYANLSWNELAVHLDRLVEARKSTGQANELESYRIELEIRERQLREAQWGLEAWRARYKDVYDHAPVAYVTLDDAASVIQANRTAAALFGRPRSKLVGTSFVAAACLADAGAFRAHLRRCLASRRSETCELEWRTPSGEAGVLELGTRVTVFSSVGPVHYQVTIIDATAMGRARAVEGDLKAERRARAEAKEVGRLKDQFIAIASHGLRTPLHLILGWMQIVKSRPDDRGTIERATDVVQTNARMLTRTVEDIFDAARMIVGSLEVDFAPTDLADAVRRAVETARPDASTKGLTVNATVAGDCLVRGDSERLGGLVANLLSNAIKFGRPGGRVQVTLARMGPMVRLKVSDDGCGIEAKDLPHVFDSFRQADSSTRRTHGGLGLGLAVARHIAVMHGGTIEACSEGPGWGTTVTVDLPTVAEATAESPPPASSSRPVSHGPPSLSGVKVLFVDDEPASNELAELALGDHGATVLTASSVESALDLVHGFAPDVIVSDIAMPSRDGFDLIREVRKLPPPLGGIPAIAMTAYARAQDAARALEAGFTRHLVKPVEPRGLAEAVSALLGGWEPADSSWGARPVESGEPPSRQDAKNLGGADRSG